MGESPMFDPQRLETLDDATVKDLREALSGAGFDGALIGRAEAVAPGMVDQLRLPVVHWWLRRQAGAGATLARVFAYGDEVARSEIEGALSAALVGELLEVGFLTEVGESLSSPVRVMPFEGLWIASDEMATSGDPVMGPGATTLQLARALAASEGEKVLDVGCGAGTLALLAASRGAGEVVGVDLMERAVQWSRFNARLNELEGRFYAGDLLDPVAGQRFDLIVSQPPFVIRADGAEATTYLHGGRFGDELALKLVRRVGEVLAPGGRAVVLFDSPRRQGEPVERRLGQAFEGSGLQVCGVIAPGHKADQQAIAYSSLKDPGLGERYAAAVMEYREHLAQLEIESSAHVLLVARRPREQEPAAVVTLDAESLARWDAAAVEELLARVELSLASDNTLMGSEVELSRRGVLLEERPLGGGQVRKFRVRFEGGMAPEMELSDAAAVFVDAVQRGGTARKVVERFAKAAGARPPEVRAQVLSFLRQMLISGLVLPRRAG